MAITTTYYKNKFVSLGNRKEVFGKSVLSGTASTGDVVVSPLSNIDFFTFITKGTTAKAAAVNEDFPLAGNAVTIHTESNDATVYWKAIGY